MTRTPEDGVRWLKVGTSLCRQALADLSDNALTAPARLPGWTRKHLIAHLAGNAEGLNNLLTWARTGVETPMYTSPQARLDSIQRGAVLPTRQLRTWFDVSAQQLVDAVAKLPASQWDFEVKTAQGRTVAVNEVPWLRAREVMVHAVDLAAGITFADLPADFCAALRSDIRAKRGDTIPAVTGHPAEVTAWLAGRPYRDVTTSSGDPARSLPPWL